METKKQSCIPFAVAAWTACGLMACIPMGCAVAPKATKPAPPTSATAGNTTIVAIAPAESSNQCSLPEFLGLPGLARGTGGVLQRLGSRLLSGLDLTGRFPGLQPQPPILPITDPANLEEGAPPAVQAAAEIKQEEDAAPQKIMALRYLATLGCGGCYPKVEDALLEGLSDCTESVRFEAVKALQCKPECGCKYCSSPSCCSMKVRKRLQELTTCEKEPSERIRRLARIALACCGTKPLAPDDQEDVPREGPPATEPEGAEATASGNTASALFNNIQLVRFDEAVPSQPGDMVLANVNGELIFESQALPLVEASMRNTEGLSPNDPVARRKQLALEVTRLIDWTLIGQQCKNEVRLASAGAQPAVPSPAEIQAWFERHLVLDTQVTPQELLAYYEFNKEKFRTPQLVRWERLEVKTEQFSSREVAMEIASYLRNRSLGLEVQSPAEFSRDRIKIQTIGWTELSKIKSETERAAIQQLQPGQVSNIIESTEGVLLVRLLERQGEGYKPVTAVVDPIRNAILADRKRAAELRLIGQLRSQSQIWTVFDSPIRTNKDQVPASTAQQRN
ncbi:MAG: peptidylprolyl isomerase [Pirellulaceae bacterium]|nr:peptidylprolyl isomerase [Pirellulaceae bacterium]